VSKWERDSRRVFALPLGSAELLGAQRFGPSLVHRFYMRYASLAVPENAREGERKRANDADVVVLVQEQFQDQVVFLVSSLRVASRQESAIWRKVRIEICSLKFPKQSTL